MDGQPRLFVWAKQKKKNPNKRLHKDRGGAEWQKKQVYLLRGHIVPICCNGSLKCASAPGFNGITGYIKKQKTKRPSDDNDKEIRGWIIRHQTTTFRTKQVLHTQPLILYMCHLISTCRLFCNVIIDRAYFRIINSKYFRVYLLALKTFFLLFSFFFFFFCKLLQRLSTCICITHNVITHPDILK